MLRVEFHCHTVYSKDCLVQPDRIIDTCLRKGIDRVVVTDHNTIGGALRAKELNPNLVIIGEEIMTEEGELLAAFLDEEIPPGLPALTAIARLREQGAFISVSHPFDWMRKGHWRPEDLRTIVPYVDAIETFNARCMRPSFNHQALVFAREHALLGTAGSDAHSTLELGRACMLLPPFDDALSLKTALEQVEYQVRLSSPLVHIISRYASIIKKIRGV